MLAFQANKDCNTVHVYCIYFGLKSKEDFQKWYLKYVRKEDKESPYDEIWDCAS